MNLRLLALLALSSCAMTNPLTVIEAPGNYPPPVSSAEWMLTKYGYYIDRNQELDSPIHYKALYDNRAAKKVLMDKYQTTDDFAKYYPAFIKHTGIVDCATKANSVLIEQYNEKMQRLLFSRSVDKTDVSKSLCLRR